MTGEDRTPPSPAIQLTPMNPAALPLLLNNSNVPKVYMQSFANLATPLDLSIIAMNIGAPAAVITMTYSTAKSLAKALGQVIDTYEKTMETDLLNAEEVQEKYRAGGKRAK